MPRPPTRASTNVRSRPVPNEARSSSSTSLVRWPDFYGFNSRTKNLKISISVPSVQIQGDSSDRYVEAGSKVVLGCKITKWLIKPQVKLKIHSPPKKHYIFLCFKVVYWFHDGQRLFNGQSGVRTTFEERNVPGSQKNRNRSGKSGGSDQLISMPQFGQPSITSELTLTEPVDSTNSGKYECLPDNIKPAFINLIVIKGEERLRDT